MNKLLFIDVETTGIDRNKSGVWQIGGLIECGKRKEEFLFECDIFEQDDFDPTVTDITGITLEKLSSFSNPAQVHDQLIKIFDKYVDRYDKTDKFTTIAYGASFDQDMLERWFKNNDDDFLRSWTWHPWICMMSTAALMLKDERSSIKSFKLSSIAEYLNIKVDENKTHNALYDAQIAREIYYKLIKK